MLNDCLNYNKQISGCSVLRADVCKKGPCKFYKNKELLDKQVARVRERIPDYMPYSKYRPGK
jgi:hypothetical protein